MDLFFSVLTLIGGLCLFMFGMSLMGNSLERAAGNKLQSLLAKFTSNKFAGFLTGMAVTAVIQSSSATTVMVVGFVNSSLMTLRQAINVIMGANIGTTITSWILSLNEIGTGEGQVATNTAGEVFETVLKFFKPNTFVPILAVIGLVLFMFSKSSRKKEIGTILLGFATLMFGMTIMSDATSNDKIKAIVTSVFAFFGPESPLGWFAPIVAVLAGAIFTAVLQSSSASVGILQTLAISTPGAVTIGSCFPIIMGQNIGTCITAALSSAGANRNGKRTAVVHLSFNIIGTTIMLVIFYIVRIIFEFAIGDMSFLNTNAGAVSIATMHTLFNVTATLVLLPASKLLEKIAYKVLPISENEKQDKLVLDERLLNTPAIALGVCRDATITMAKDATEAFTLGLASLTSYTDEDADKIRKIEDKTDHYEDVIGTYLVKLGSKQYGEKTGDESARLLRLIGDFERISDHAVNILESAEEMKEKRFEFSEEARAELVVISNAISEILGLSLTAFVKNDISLAYQIEPLEEVIDDLKEQLRTRHIYRLQQGNCTIATGFIWSDLLTSLERTADHCSNIAACLIDTAQDNLNIHESVREIKNDKEKFQELYLEYSKKYALPANV